MRRSDQSRGGDATGRFCAPAFGLRLLREKTTRRIFREYGPLGAGAGRESILALCSVFFRFFVSLISRFYLPFPFFVLSAVFQFSFDFPNTCRQNKCVHLFIEGLCDSKKLKREERKRRRKKCGSGIKKRKRSCVRENSKSSYETDPKMENKKYA